MTFAPAFFIRGLFRDYSRVWSDSALLPAHARIMFDAQGLGPKGEPIRGIRLLEATTYEDMAALCNLAVERSTAAESITTPTSTKTFAALCRATVAAAVYFVEAYLNGVAFDYLADHAATLSADEKSVLEDWGVGKCGVGKWVGSLSLDQPRPTGGQKTRL